MKVQAGEQGIGESDWWGREYIKRKNTAILGVLIIHHCFSLSWKPSLIMQARQPFLSVFSLVQL